MTDGNNQDTNATNQQNVSGGPIGHGDTLVEQVNQNQQTTLQPPQQQSGVSVSNLEPVHSKPIYLGGKRFDSADDLAKYTSELEIRQRQLELQPQQTVAQQSEKKLSDLLFEDPEEYSRVIEERAVTRIKSEQNAREFQQNTRNKFFSEYADLKGQEDLVEMYASKMKNDLENEHPDVAFRKVATAVRSRLQTLRGSTQSTEEVSSRPTTVASPSSGSAPTATSVPIKTDFVSQLQGMRKKSLTK